LQEHYNDKLIEMGREPLPVYTTPLEFRNRFLIRFLEAQNRRSNNG
jgi:hypothetical protein